MMAHKHLHELLKEDQEPFQLKNYIEDRRSQLKRASCPSRTALQVKKRKPIIESSVSSSSSPISKRVLCRHACFLSFHDSPDIRKSPLFEFPSPAKSPCRPQNATVLLHIPARTAALLLEAAMRIQKQQSSSRPKPKTQIKNGFGLFGSILKRLKDRNRSKKREIKSADNVAAVSRKSEVKAEENIEVKVAYEMGFPNSFNHRRLSSAAWSESNEEKSLDLETSTSSCRSEDSEEIEYMGKTRGSGDFASAERRLCSSPLGPFRFSLQKSPSLGSRTPNFSSPAASPNRRKKEDKEHCELDDSDKNQTEEEEDEKQQCSPVSVLEPPFEDDGHEAEAEDDDDDEEEDDYDLESSYAIVQKAKQQLLYKLRRFEKLAELDPIELEKIMLEEPDDNDGDEDMEEDDCRDEESMLLHRDKSIDSIVNEVLSKSGPEQENDIPCDMKKLVSDMISEEKKEANGADDGEVVLGRVCKRLDSWQGVNFNTIDMMIELDFRNDGWNNYREQVAETAIEIEVSIFGLLVEELSEELIFQLVPST